MASLIDSNSRFGINPTNLNIQRAQFDMSFTHKTSFNVGELIPFDVKEVLPGDTFNIETNILARLQTLLTPIMDNLYLDMYYFFVPNRLVWTHWQDFCGENTKSSWYPTTQYQVPKLFINNTTKVNEKTWYLQEGTVLDYMGIPSGQYFDSGDKASMHVNALPVRAYTLIYNEWFRDENLQDPVIIDKSDVNLSINNDLPERGGKPFIVGKYHDYFTSALPCPQKGPDVTIPVIQDVYQPVYARTGDSSIVPYVNKLHSAPLKFGMNDESGWTPVSQGYAVFTGNGNLATTNNGSVTASSTTSVGNLWARMEGLPIMTINQLRLAMQTQKLYERDARGGTRYIEILRSHFGVISPDARLQRPELLSYNHIPINVTQIVQNSATAEGTTPQGTTTAMSLTMDSDNSFKKSFVEHGYLIGLMCVRYKHSYQQGINRMWSRSNRFDYYWPVFSNIGEQPILNKEIFASGKDEDDEVFGYQEAWAEYRYQPDRTSGEMRSTHPTPLDSWHLGDVYDTLPKLSSDWIKEDKNNVDRVLAVTSNVSNQIFCDIYIKCYATRPMPMYSIPGYVDHF